MLQALLPVVQDAARKALQEAFAGKKDPFAAAEERARKRGGGGSDGGGGGGGSGGGGGGSGGGGGFNFSEWGDSFRKSAIGFLQTLATILLFVAALGALALWKPLLTLLSTLVRLLLRLDGPRPARPQTAPGSTASSVEAAVIGKYAADEDEGEDDEE